MTNQKNNDSESVVEAQIKIRVNSRGVKTKRLKCPKGYKISPSGKSCVPITGAEKANKRIAIKHAIRTKKQQGQAYQKRTIRKRLKAMKRRKSYGLK